MPCSAVTHFFVRCNRRQGGVRRNDLMTQFGSPTISLSGRSAGWIRFSSGGQQDFFRRYRPLWSGQREPVRRTLDLNERFFRSQGASASIQPANKRREDIGGPVAGRKILPVSGSILANTPSDSSRSTTSCGPNATKAEYKKRPAGPKASTIPPDIRRMGEIASRAAAEMRIFTPGRRFFSKSKVRLPRCAAPRQPSAPPALLPRRQYPRFP